jgi:hypothetical protein
LASDNPVVNNYRNTITSRPRSGIVAPLAGDLDLEAIGVVEIDSVLPPSWIQTFDLESPNTGRRVVIGNGVAIMIDACCGGPANVRPDFGKRKREVELSGHESPLKRSRRTIWPGRR